MLKARCQAVCECSAIRLPSVIQMRLSDSSFRRILFQHQRFVAEREDAACTRAIEVGNPRAEPWTLPPILRHNVLCGRSQIVRQYDDANIVRNSNVRRAGWITLVKAGNILLLGDG